MEYKYTPKTKTQLIADIRAEIKLQGSRANLNCIDTSAITNMSELFSKFKTFNGDISQWNVSNVTNMWGMFDGSHFNGDISKWDVSKVTDMEYMFRDSYFRGDISQWNVDNVEFFFPMFHNGYSPINDEHKPKRFQLNRNDSSPTLTGKKYLSETAKVSFSLSGDGVLRISGNLNSNLHSDWYRGSGCHRYPVKHLVIAEGVTEIGDYMFYGWNQIEEVTLPSTLIRIGDEVFGGCRNISTIHFPENGLEIIGNRVFSSCSESLKELHLPQSLKSLGSGNFENCGAITELILPDSLTEIGYRTFSLCKNLHRVILPKSLIKISKEAFSGCKMLEEVVMSDKVEVIDYHAFGHCPKLRKTIILPSTIKELNDFAFDQLIITQNGLNYEVTNYITDRNECCVSANECKGALIIPKELCYNDRIYKVTQLGDFHNCRITKVVIPSSITTIKNGTFWGCESLESVTIPDSVTSIEEHAFSDCTSLSSIEIPDSVTSIEHGVFSGCIKLNDVHLGKHTTCINEEAFYGCESLQYIEIPDSVTKIGESAFGKCKSLIDIKMPTSLECLSIYALDGTAVKNQEGAIYVGPILCGFGGIMPRHACLRVKEGTTTIAEEAFRGESNLEAVILPESLKHIGYCAFEDCENLKYVHLPKSLQYIGADAFYRTALKKVTAPWEAPIVIEMSPFPQGVSVYIPHGSMDAYITSRYWKKYHLSETTIPSVWEPLDVPDGCVEIREKEKRLVIIEQPQDSYPDHLYGAIVMVDPEMPITKYARKAITDLLYDAFKGTAMFLDWEEDCDFGSAQPLSKLLEYDKQRFAVVDMPKDACPKTKRIDKHTYLTDEEYYDIILNSINIDWQAL